MASEDVIELGSSDDEAEPAPKKNKPMPNAMVCIPRKIHEVTIRPSKLHLAKSVPLPKLVPVGLPPAKFTAARGVFPSKEVTIVKKGVPTAKKRTTVTKPPVIVSNPFASKSKINGKPVQKNIKPLIKPQMKPQIKPQIKPLIKPQAKPIIKFQTASTSHPVFFAKISESSNMGNNSLAILKNPIRIQAKQSLNNLPPSITVRKTTQSSIKPIIFMKAANQILRPAINSKQVNEVQTVELDDDEGAPTTSSPAWYIRPEEQTDVATLEQENNAEPELPTMIEITIEDSPVKTALNKRTCEVGAELAITIDDSPVKATADEKASSSGSGSDNEATSTKVPNSKKKLEYHKESENENKKTLEIEIDIPFEDSLQTIGIRRKDTDVDVTVEFPEVSLGRVQATPEPSQKDDGGESSTQKTNITASNENKIVTSSSSNGSEFHSVYQSFINICFQLENSEDMKKIVEKKIKAYYRQVPKEYTESEEFVDMVASKILAMKANPEKMYLYIKDIVDELNMQRKIAKSQIVNRETKTEEPDKFAFGEQSEYDSKQQRQIRKLEKTIKKLHRAIQKLEEQEVDFDDEDDSVYLLTERYKERMVRVYAKFCQLTNTKMPSEPRIVVDARPGHPSGPAKRLEKWINKKVPIGTPLPFPDFHDVIRCVRDANDIDKLGWNEADIIEEARDLFTRCGKKLQRRRQENEWRLAASRIAVDVDPAENNEQLKCMLEQNKKIAANKETDIFNKYADRQKQLKLEGEEIGDKEAEESPVESEEEEANDESVSLENKGNRKKRLKRLIHEISKGPSKGKENQPSEEPEVKTNRKEIEVNDDTVTIKETDTKENKENSGDTLEKSKNDDKESSNAAETLSVSSDNSHDLESDIDELHLLQKLHSGNEAELSTLESSDSDSLIAISDSIESGSDIKKQLSDVISIENSSYSESEAGNEDSIPIKNTECVNLIVPDCQPNNESETVVIEMEADCSNVIGSSPTNDAMSAECTNSDTEIVKSKSNNNGYIGSVENILLASSDEEIFESQNDGSPSADGASINLRDDLISIDETIVGSVVDQPENGVEKEASIIIPEKVSNADETSVVENNTNDNHIKDNNKITEESDTIESVSIDTSQDKAPSASKKESAWDVVSLVSDDTIVPDTLTQMDVDQSSQESEKSLRIEENLTSALSPEVKKPNLCVEK